MSLVQQTASGTNLICVGLYLMHPKIKESPHGSIFNFKNEVGTNPSNLKSTETRDERWYYTNKVWRENPYIGMMTLS